MDRKNRMGRGRLTGKTTAYILRELLRFTENDGPLDMIRPSTKRGELYKEQMNDIQKKLDYFGIPTRKVWYNEEQKTSVQKGKTFEFPVFTNIFDKENLIDRIRRTIDKMVFDELLKYGISNTNLVRQLHRINVETFYPDPGCSAEIKRHFFIDNIYAFTLCENGSIGRDCMRYFYTVWIEKEKNI